MIQSRRRTPLPLLAGFLLLAPPGLDAQAPQDAVDHDDRPVATAVRTDVAPRIDGLLDDAAWSAAVPVDGFTQIDPEEGQPSRQRTVVRVLYDDDALYVAARLYDDGEIIGRLGRRDMALGDSDWFGLMIDSYHDHRTAFGFDVNPAGVRRDEIKVIEQDDNSWDPVWEVATTVDAEGWTAEYRIPFSQLRFSDADEQTWGVQFERMIGRLREYSVSTFIPKSAQGGVPGYGHLTGLVGIKPGRRLEVLPYVVARSEHVDPGANPLRTQSDQSSSAGLDLKYRMTSNLTLDATINPDFGQVEVDPAVINLGVYETRFDEKRPFFIEGSEIFGMNTGGGGQLFYSRRIGRAPQIRLNPYNDVPQATTILGAAKLSGRTGGGWSIGVMEALTAEETGRWVPVGGGAEEESVVEPLTNYFVGRARRDLRGGASAVGGLVTMTHRGESPLEQPLHSAAYAAAADFRHEWDRRRWSLRGALTVSRVTGPAEAVTRTQRLSNHYFQRPDADYLDVDEEATSLTGVSAYVQVNRQAGEHWLGGLSLATTTPGYEVNDLGFNYRTDRRDVQANLRYQQNQPGDVIRNWYVDGMVRAETNYDEQLIANWQALTATAQTTGYWVLHARLSHSFRANDDRLTRGGPIAVRPASSNAFGHFSTDGRKALQFAGTVSAARDEFDGSSAGLSAQVRWRPSSSWNVSAGPAYSRRSVAAQYVTQQAETCMISCTTPYMAYWIFAPLEYREVALETRLNMAFSPTLSLELYAQPLLSGGDYGDPVFMTDSGEFPTRSWLSPVPDRDFNQRSLRGNAVLRWEWRRGSTLYLAWQQSRAGFDQLGDFDFGRDQRALWDTQPDNIFVVKVNYWLNP